MKTPIELASKYANDNFESCDYPYDGDERITNFKELKNAFSAGYEAAQPKWISVKDELPHCYRLGFWDGKKSDFVAGKDANGKLHIACLYSGFMDGHEFNDFYDQNDYSVEIVEWCKIPD